MNRRDVSTALLASFSGAAVLASRDAEAQSGCTAPCYAVTAAESDVGIVPANTAYPPQNILRYAAANVSDYDLAIESALLVATSNKGNPGVSIFFPSGTYPFTKTITKAPSFKCINLIGESFQTVILDFSRLPAGESGICVQGGSGTLCGAIFEGFTVQGNSSTNLIEIDGQDGLVLRRLKFGTGATGLWFHNGSHGAFTEFCVAKECYFQKACSQAVKYSVTKGDGSFHGSGLIECVIEQGSSSACIAIEGRSLVYNAPLGVHWFGTGGTLVDNGSSTLATFYGNIGCEWQGGMPVGIHTLASSASGQSVCFAGSVLSNAAVHYGVLRIGFAAAFLGPESSNGTHFVRQEKESYGKDLTAGPNTLLNITEFGQCLVTINIWGPNYDFRLLIVASPAYDASPGYVSTVTTLRAYDAAGYGPPAFTVDKSGILMVGNGAWPGFKVTCRFTVSGMGLNPAEFGAGDSMYKL